MTRRQETIPQPPVTTTPTDEPTSQRRVVTAVPESSGEPRRRVRQRVADWRGSAIGKPATRETATRQRKISTPGQENAAILNLRAYRLQLRGRHAEAEPLLRQALALGPGYAHALYNLGWSLLEQGRAREALEPLRRTAALQPRRWEPQQRLAEAHAMLGNRSAALAAAERARALRYAGSSSRP